MPIRDPFVGNWRNSTEGLGFGKFSFDVNAALVPANLRAIAALANIGVLPAGYSTNASAYAEVWETYAYTFFEVSIDAATAGSRLSNYIQQSNITGNLTGINIQGADCLAAIASANAGWDNSSVGVNSSSTANKTFYALSLKQDGTPVEVGAHLHRIVCLAYKGFRHCTQISASRSSTAITYRPL